MKDMLRYPNERNDPAGGEKEAFLSFLLDPTTQPTVLALVQTHGQEVIDQVCMLTRTWLYFQHRARFRALGLWDALIWDTSVNSC